MSGYIMDYPTAWEFVLRTNPVDHHPECSFRAQQMLCDCSILDDEYDRRKALKAGSR